MSEEQIKKEMARLKKENPDLSDEQIAEKVAELALSGGEKAEKQAEKTPKQAEKTEYVCHTRCTFEGVYYKEGDILVTDAQDVPEYFAEKE